MRLRDQTASAAKWSIAASLLQKAISLGSTVILARILSPYEFGLFAIAFVVIDGFGLFKSVGFDSALIQRKDEVEKAADVAFFVIPLLGILVYLLLVASLPFIEFFVEEEELPEILRVLGLIFIVNCFARVPIALMEKEMRYLKIGVIDVVGQTIFTVVAVSLAVNGTGVWSLVYGYLSMTVSRLVLAWASSSWRPSFRFHYAIAVDMFHFGKFMFLESLAWFLQRNLDRILIAALLGVREVGIYAIAYNLANLPNDYIGSKIKQVLFASYSKIQHDLEKMRRAFLSVLKWTLIVSTLLGLTIFSLGGEIVTLLFGNKWVAAIPVLQILAWSGVFNILANSNRSVFLALKQSKLNFYNVCVQIALYLVFVAPAAWAAGTAGVAWVVTAGSFVVMILSFRITCRLTGLSMREVLGVSKYCLTASLCMILVVFMMKHLLFSLFPHLLLLNISLLSACGFLTYVLALTRIDGSVLLEGKRLLSVRRA